MIAAKYGDDDKTIILLVLEPGNMEKLKKGEPIFKFLNEFLPNQKERIELVFAYTPDAVWVAEQVKAGVDLPKAIEMSLTREPVLHRGKTAEDMVKVQ